MGKILPIRTIAMGLQIIVNMVMLRFEFMTYLFQYVLHMGHMVHEMTFSVAILFGASFC